MAREATCPACQGRVPVPKSTRHNAKVRCPLCDESFVPPWLRVTVVEDEDEEEEPYDPKTADAYKVKKPVGKKVRAKVSTEGSTADNDRRWKPQRGGGLGGKLLLGMGIGLGLVIPLAYLIGKWAVTKNVGVLEAMLAIIGLIFGLWLVGAGLGLFANRFRAMMDRLFGPD